MTPESVRQIAQQSPVRRCGQVGCVICRPDAAIAFAELVQAAHNFTRQPFGQLDERAFYRLREALTKFNFEEPS